MNGNSVPFEEGLRSRLALRRRASGVAFLQQEERRANKDQHAAGGSPMHEASSQRIQYGKWRQSLRDKAKAEALQRRKEFRALRQKATASERPQKKDFRLTQIEAPAQGTRFTATNKGILRLTICTAWKTTLLA